MTVDELRKALAELPPGLRVVVRGYESGVDDVTECEQYNVRLNANDEWYYGAHEQVDSLDARNGVAGTPVVELVGGRS